MNQVQVNVEWIAEVLIGRPGMHPPAIRAAGASPAGERASGRSPPAT